MYSETSMHLFEGDGKQNDEYGKTIAAGNH
jgi:hypothetical protein